MRDRPRGVPLAVRRVPLLQVDDQAPRAERAVLHLVPARGQGGRGAVPGHRDPRQVLPALAARPEGDLPQHPPQAGVLQHRVRRGRRQAPPHPPAPPRREEEDLEPLHGGPRLAALIY